MDDELVGEYREELEEFELECSRCGTRYSNLDGDECPECGSPSVSVDDWRTP